AEGAGAVTMRRVAADAGVTTMATYRHYPNRGALLRSVTDAAFAELGKSWGRRGDPNDFDSRVEGLLDDFLDFVLDKPNLYVFLITERREGMRQFPRDFQDGGSPAFIPIMDAVKQGMRDGALRPDDPLEVTLAITATAMGLSNLYIGGRIELPETEFRALAKRSHERILNGFRA
ncbi:MAG: TetR/AcrR family transcriptional regulator, partial [Stackebrandtia sp.]